MKKKNTWKEEYLRILLNGPADADDYPLAAELLDEQLAKGTYLPNHQAPGQIANLMWRGINTKGRIFVDELEEKIRRSKRWYRAWLAIGSFCWWFLGYCTESIFDYFKPLIFGA
ncbi:MAG: hypothetical protein E6Q69_03225 [Aquipseudomonas alcaligenes]|uniref:Uncharacterized protein n=1 Tax=Aquipseudomonas alcaligenes TaxID=43263 RepID=A0A5C7WDD8_AQUAC|nr:MAG: hypothetical protein E6Q69_03225 [Pseudomonas alcaligenes]